MLIIQIRYQVHTTPVYHA